MYDVLLHVQPELASHASTHLKSLGLAPQEYVLATIHRAGNTDDPKAMGQIAQALGDVGLPVVFPVHPRTRKRMHEYGLSWSAQVRLIEPVGYRDMLALEQAAACVATDSGGVQKEAFLLGVPCVTLREETEWPETREGGWNTLVGSDPQAIVTAIHRPKPAATKANPFGRGDAAWRIAQSLSMEPLSD